MYVCIKCHDYKGIEKCILCDTLFCAWCSEITDPHEPEDHIQIYDLYDYLDALRERSLELSADARGDYRAHYL